MVWFGLWCLTPLLTKFQLYYGRQFLFVEEIGVPGENHRPATTYELYHLSTPRHERRMNSQLLVVINSCLRIQRW